MAKWESAPLAAGYDTEAGMAAQVTDQQDVSAARRREIAQVQADLQTKGNALDPASRSMLQSHLADLQRQEATYSPTPASRPKWESAPLTPVQPVAEAKKGEPVRSTLDRVLSGFRQGAADLAAGAGQVGTAILAPYDLAADAIQGRKLGTGNRERRQSIDDFAKEHGANDWTSTVNQAAPEMIVTGGPMGGVEKKVAEAAGKVVGPRVARLAGAGSDVVTNSAYAAAQAAAKGEDPAEAAKYGALGATAGRGVARVAGGVLKPVLSREAETLVKSGVTPTPGQAIGGVARTMEDASTSIPGWGDTVQWARGRAAKQYADSEVNRAIAPLEAKVKTGMGETVEETVEKARQIVSDSYDDVLPRTFIDPKITRQAISDWAQFDVPKISLLTDGQKGQLEHYVATKIAPAMQQSLDRQGHIPGEIAKQIDTELGHFARKFSGSVNPSDHPLGEAFYGLQSVLRDTLQGVDSTAKAQLRATNHAHRNLLPVIKASDRAAGQGGRFSPLQMHQAAESFDQKASDLTAAARQVLPSTVPDSGTARRLVTGGGATLAGLGKPLVIGGTLGLALNNPAGLHFMIHGVPGVVNGIRSQLKPSVREWFDTLSLQKQAEFIARYAEQESSVNSLAAQVGRHMASQPEEQEAP